MANIVFDLDGTVIDTSHRYRNLPCGKIDLQYWFENSTPEKIAKDSLLPLAHAWRRYYTEGHTIIVCTARDFSDLNGVDLGQIYRDYLAANDLPYHALLYRNLAGANHESYADGALKVKLLGDYAAERGRVIEDMQFVMFDDNADVLDTLTKRYVRCYDAISHNRNLRKGKNIIKIAA